MIRKLKILVVIQLIVILGGCSIESSESNTLNSQDINIGFGKNTVCRVIDSLQQGSYHYFKCINQAENLSSEVKLSALETTLALCSEAPVYVMGNSAAQVLKSCFEKSLAQIESNFFADKTLAESLCNDVVDSLQPGSRHWMECHRESNALLKEQVSSVELVAGTCSAIQESLSNEENLGRCYQGGVELIISSN